MIVQSDEERSQYHYKFTGKDWAECVGSYDLSVKYGQNRCRYKTVDCILTYLELFKYRDCIP
jgi:cytidylate kinase